MSRWYTLSSVNSDKVVPATLYPKAFASEPSWETKVHSHGTSYSPNYPRSSDLSSPPVIPLGSWLSIPSSWLIFQLLLRSCFALAASLSPTFLPQPYVSPTHTPHPPSTGEPLPLFLPRSLGQANILQAQVVVWPLLLQVWLMGL